MVSTNRSPTIALQLPRRQRTELLRWRCRRHTPFHHLVHKYEHDCARDQAMDTTNTRERLTGGDDEEESDHAAAAQP
jgi:hypothetical protein